MSLIGIDLVLVTLGVWGLQGAAPDAVYPAAHLVGVWLLGPLALLALATGVVLGWLTPWGLLKYWWTTVKLAITAVLTVVIAAVLVPRLAAAADRATGTAEAITQADRLPLVMAPAFGVALLVVNVVLGVYKPRWRLRSGPTSPADRLHARQETGAARLSH